MSTSTNNTNIRPFADNANANSTSTLTLSSISSSGSAASRAPNPNQSSIVVTLAKTTHPDHSYTLSTAPSVTRPAAAPNSVEQLQGVEPADDPLLEDAGAPTGCSAVRLEAGIAPRKYVLYDDAKEGAALSNVCPPPPPSVKRLSPEELEVTSAGGHKMATIRNVNPGGNKASKSHVDIHVLGNDGNVVMAVRGTNSRHVVLVGPKGGRTFMGWLSKIDPVEGDDSSVEKWTINLKSASDLPVACWMIVAIDEFYEMTPETRALRSKSDQSAHTTSDMDVTVGNSNRRTNRRGRVRGSKAQDKLPPSNENARLLVSKLSTNHFPEREVPPTFKLDASLSDVSESEDILDVTSSNLRASKKASSGPVAEREKTSSVPRRLSLDFLRPGSKADKSDKLASSKSGKTSRASKAKGHRWSLRSRSGSRNVARMSTGAL